MTSRQTTILGFLTLIATLGAIWVLFGERHGDSDLRGQRLLPDFTASLDRLARVTITEGDATGVTLLRDNDARDVWRITEKSGHVADGDRLRGLVAALATMRIELLKTDDPALYDRIGLGADATELRLFDAKGDELLALAIGTRIYRNRSFSTYVRILPGARSYLVSGLSEIRAEPSRWLPQMVFSLERRRLASLRMIPASGEPEVMITRTAPNEAFRLAGMADSEVETGFMALDQMATSATAIAADDARPAIEIESFEPIARLEIASFDGLEADIALYGSGDGSGDAWAVLAIAAAPAVSEDSPENAAAIAAEAQAISTRTQGFAYRIPNTKVASLIKGRKDLVKPRDKADQEEDEP